MGGICGIINFDGAPLPHGVLGEMVQAVPHRGREGTGCWGNTRAALADMAQYAGPAARRTSQPLAEGPLVLVADARVDNRKDLGRDLAGKGFLPEPAATDAELILAAYRCWGTDCPNHLIGDFAFAIWDERKEQLFAVRDPMGMRAFYYRAETKRLIFATEVKQILAAPEVPVRLFEPAVAAHLAGCFTPLDWTFYEGIAQLPPGYSLLAGPAGLRTWSYGGIDAEKRIEYAREEEYAEHFLALFQEAVRCRLCGSGPVGIFLSGGLDSGSIAAMAGWLRQQEDGQALPSVHAYSFGFETLPECDERFISKHITRHYDLPTTTVQAEAAWPLKDYPAHGPDRDEPFIGVYQALLERTLATARADGIRLMLSGDRGDLVMGMAIYDHTGLFWRGVWKPLLRELRQVSRWRGTPLRREVWRRVAVPSGVAFWPPHRAPRLREALRQVYNGRQQLSALYPSWVRSGFARRTGVEALLQQSEAPLPVRGIARRQRYRAVTAPMHMRGAVWSERSQARFGIGFADPWSDRRLVEFALAVPQRVLNRVGMDKRLTRQAMRGIMPEPARQAACKISPYPLYQRALVAWAKPVVKNLIEGSQAGARNYLDAVKLRAHYEAICQGEPIAPCFWWALTLEMWLRRYWSA